MIAILSDIHGNLHALEAVLADMPKISAIWVLGDFAGGLPFPCEVIDRILNLSVPVTAVLGNWEEMLIDSRHGRHPEYWERKQFGTMAWTVEALKPHHWTYLENLGETQVMGEVTGRALLYHGMPEDSFGQIKNQEPAEKTAAGHTEKWLLGGHYHKTRLYRVGEKRVVVNGSVGISMDKIGGTACYALLDDENITFRHVAYDLDAALSAFKASELFERGPYFSRAVAAAMITGRDYANGYNGLFPFVESYVKERLGQLPKVIPAELWDEAAEAWRVEDWLEEKLK